MDTAGRVVRAIGNKSGELSLLLDEQFNILWHSSTLTAFLGWESVVGRSGIDFVHPDDVELALDTMARASARSPHAHFDPVFAPGPADIRLSDTRGDWHTFETTSWNLLDDSDVRAILITCRRVSDRRDLALAIEQLGTGADIDVVLPTIARLAEHSMGGGPVRAAFVWRDDEQVRIALAPDRPLAPELVEVAELTWSSRLVEPLLITDLDDQALNGAASIARRLGFRAAFVVPIGAPDGRATIGSMVAWGVSSVDFHVAEQSPLHVTLRLAALSLADHRMKRSLRWAASRDPLTGLANRAEFERQLEQVADGQLVLLYIDLDHFKPVNDQYGHLVGDLVLQHVARRITEVVGTAGLVGRLGGDEFAVLCAGMGDPTDGREVANRIVLAIAQPLIAGGHRVSIGASVGVAVGAQPLIPSVLLRRADEALYEAKHAGRNTVCVAS